MVARYTPTANVSFPFILEVELDGRFIRTIKAMDEVEACQSDIHRLKQ
ncbi:hypothetical protein [Photorhabdus temperata]|nr:hypothetical protein [Photorhabdus temperata]